MRFLVATRNKDKFNVVKLLIESLDLHITLVPLFAINIFDDIVEEGSIEERAVQKAKFFFGKLQELENAEQFDGVLGTDDGIQIGDQLPSPNSKELTDSILEEKYPKGTSIGIVRAFAVITKSGLMRSTQSVIPFVFLGNENGITRTDGQYPLSKVLAPLGMTVPFSQLNDEESNKFMLEYSKKELTEILVDL